MTARMNLSALEPAAYEAMLGLEKYLSRSTLPAPLLELVRLRASQINGCAYCVDMHSADAKKGGETDERLYAVAVWREAPFFTEEERAALALTEAATRLSEGGDRVPDEVWDQAAKHFDEHTLAQLVVAIATINAWNRIGVATRMVPESYKG
ncbi:carboxymuconolactone decarboxylase family protein [Thermopolyspora sp. NPDC052614]|uniref:carboxymuconolactone decarboxylase family protein n=1 Tax=Thermopolyspora sp. NPDC052614 TaxID=3155682 RepID=UPI00342AF087